MNLENNDILLYRKNSASSGESSGTEEDILYSITGLDSSDGAVVISQKKSALFVDGRYTLAAKQRVDPKKFEILSLSNDRILRWIKENFPIKTNILCNYQYYTHEEMNLFAAKLPNYTFSNIDLKKVLNISSKKLHLDIYHINGKNKRNEKNENRLSYVTEAIKNNKLDAFVICDPCSIAWLLNIRDLNRKYTPVILCHLLITSNNEHVIYLDDRYDYNYSNNNEDNNNRDNNHSFKYINELQKDILKIKGRIGIDKSQTPFSIKHDNFVDIKNPCVFPQALKNSDEINDIKLAAIKDSSAIVNFLYWFYNDTHGEKITELDVVEKLSYFRKQQSGFVGESFRTIAAADENAAIVHYSPNQTSNKVINNILLIDSGGQYKHGTTDITRTISILTPTEEQKFFYTLVLKGHISLAKAKFANGVSGSYLEVLARQFLWQHYQDYAHSTGHGIGYMSHVHEGPMAISANNRVPLQAGMILSNEPGYYLENNFGVRLENMMLVKESDESSSGSSNFLCFETMSLVPFDHKFIRKDLLTQDEIDWLTGYNQNIIANLNLQNNVRNWLHHYVKN